MALDLDALPDAYLAFWGERHAATFTTLRADGTPHVVPVNVTFDAARRTARVLARASSRKVANVRGAGEGGARVALCQVDGGRWATLEGVARVRTDPEALADALHRYAERYGRTPAPHPERVMIEVAVTRALGRPGS